MVSIDDRLSETAAGVPRVIPGGVPDWVRRLRGQRLGGRRLGARGALTQPRALALAGGLAVAVLGVGLSSGWIAGQADAALSASDEVTLASGGSGLARAGVPLQACGRIEEIVHTACGYKQQDHDADGIRQCVAYELKYTMWSAYGCQ